METSELVRRALDLGAVQVPEEISALVDLLKKNPPRNVLEIGSESGGTFYLWCQLAKIGGLKISLDLPTGDSGSGRYREAAALAERTAQFKCWSANVHVVIGDSHGQKTRQAVQEILDSATLGILGPGQKLDFLFIDGDHSYEGVKADFEDYKGLVRPGGLIAFHDIVDSEFHRKRGCNVAKFWKELLCSLPGGVSDCWEFHHSGSEWGGIGVIQVQNLASLGFAP
jgi:cephalosporin hydroxylase